MASECNKSHSEVYYAPDAMVILAHCELFLQFPDKRM